MIITRAEEARLRPDPYTSEECPIRRDVFVPKVAGHSDRNGRWFYEDVRFRSEDAAGLKPDFKNIGAILAEAMGAWGSLGRRGRRIW